MFPVTFSCFYFKVIKTDFEYWLNILMLIVAIGISYTCFETGTRANDGNLSWQIVPSMWFMFYYMLKQIIIDKDNMRKKTFSILFILHTVMGIVYLLKFIICKDFG